MFFQIIGRYQTDKNLREVHRYQKNIYSTSQVVYYSNEIEHYKAHGRSIMDRQVQAAYLAAHNYHAVCETSVSVW